MTLPVELSDHVRRRANFACEYCGVSETDVGGSLTIDHFRPRSHGGTDDPGNLIYCCHRCNLFKADYWPVHPGDPVFWNPREEPAAAHLLLLADGRLHPTTATGAFTLRRLRLNRPRLSSTGKWHSCEPKRRDSCADIEKSLRLSNNSCSNMRHLWKSTVCFSGSGGRWYRCF